MADAVMVRLPSGGEVMVVRDASGFCIRDQFGGPDLMEAVDAVLGWLAFFSWEQRPDGVRAAVPADFELFPELPADLAECFYRLVRVDGDDVAGYRRARMSMT